MKSIKPGRGPSFMSGVMSVVAVVFGVFWTAVTFSIGAGFMAVFGFVFIGVGIFNAVYHFKNATNENRYSDYDIVDDDEETDPFNKKYGKDDKDDKKDGEKYENGNFCPYCGARVEKDYKFCNHCGNKLQK